MTAKSFSKIIFRFKALRALHRAQTWASLLTRELAHSCMPSNKSAFTGRGTRNCFLGSQECWCAFDFIIEQTQVWLRLGCIQAITKPHWDLQSRLFPTSLVWTSWEDEHFLSLSSTTQNGGEFPTQSYSPCPQCTTCWIQPSFLSECSWAPFFHLTGWHPNPCFRVTQGSACVFLMQTLNFTWSEPAGLAPQQRPGYLPGEELRSSKKMELVFQFPHLVFEQVTRSGPAVYLEED